MAQFLMFIAVIAIILIILITINRIKQTCLYEKFYEDYADAKIYGNMSNEVIQTIKNDYLHQYNKTRKRYKIYCKVLIVLITILAISFMFKPYVL